MSVYLTVPLGSASTTLAARPLSARSVGLVRLFWQSFVGLLV
jgi:hypothetical protein